MAVNLSTVASEVVAQMNLATSYTATVSDPRAYSAQITDAVLNADGAVIEAICSNPANGQRTAFITSANVAHGGNLPARIGPIDSIIIASKMAVPWSAEEIEYQRTNTQTLTYDARYALMGNVLAHNQGAGTAAVRYCTYTRGTACQSPDEYYFPVLCGALAEVFSIEGEADSTAAFYAGQFQTMLQFIRAGQAPPPFQMA